MLTPVGPEHSGVYWRRRLMVLGAILLVLFAFWFFLLRNRGSSSDAQPTPSVSPTSTATPDPTSTGQATSAVAAPDCADSDITVSIKVAPKSVAAGEPVKLVQGIKNSGSVACRRDIGAKANTVIITSGGYPVWSSDDCSPGGPSNIVVMKPGDEYQVTVTWKGQLTEGKCPSNPPTVQAGGYDAAGKNGNVKSATTPFAVT